MDPTRVQEWMSHVCTQKTLATSGICEFDDRFKWHVVSKLAGRTRRSVTHTTHPSYEDIFRDGRVLELMLKPVYAMTAGMSKDVLLCGSTGTRALLKSIVGEEEDFVEVFGQKDVDVCIYVNDPKSDEAVSMGNRMCASIIRDRRLLDLMQARIGDWSMEECRVNSRIFTEAQGADIVAIDVPYFPGSTLRLPHTPLHVTRNDTLSGVVLYRIRLCVSQPPLVKTTFSLLDICLVQRARRPKAVRIPAWSMKVWVPTLKEAIIELEKLLEGKYVHVDESKDIQRRKQLRYLMALKNSKKICA